MLSVCLSSSLMTRIKYLFSVASNPLDTSIAADGNCGQSKEALRTTLPPRSATSSEGLQWRHISCCLDELWTTTILTVSPFRGRILFCLPYGQIARVISEDRVNRRRILVGTLSVGLLGVLALLLPSLHKTPDSASQSAQPLAQSPSETVNSRAEPDPPVVPMPAVVAKAAPLPPAPQSAAGLSDVDPHKAFGSKNAPVTMEVFSDFQCPACKTLFTTTNRRLMDDYVSSGKVYLIHRDFPLAMHAHSRVAARYARAAAQLGKVQPVEQALFV